MCEKDKIILTLLLELIGKIENFTQEFQNEKEFYNDSKSFDATMMNFIVIGKSVGKLSKEFRKSTSEIKWRKIYAYRNIVAHEYFGINAKEAWQIIKNHLPVLKKQIENILNSTK